MSRFQPHYSPVQMQRIVGASRFGKPCSRFGIASIVALSMGLISISQANGLQEDSVAIPAGARCQTEIACPESGVRPPAPRQNAKLSLMDEAPISPLNEVQRLAYEEIQSIQRRLGGSVLKDLPELGDACPPSDLTPGINEETFDRSLAVILASQEGSRRLEEVTPERELLTPPQYQSSAPPAALLASAATTTSEVPESGLQAQDRLLVEDLRELARRFDLRAADAEETSEYLHADQLRVVAQQMRLEARRIQERTDGVPPIVHSREAQQIPTYPPRTLYR